MKDTEFTDRSTSRKASDFIGVFGRCEDADGRLSNILPNNEMLKSALARQNSGRDIVDILVLAETLFRKDGEFRQRPLAFVSVGFGPISLGKDDPPWSKTIFIEADHPRWGPGNGDESGEFKDKDGDENTDIESGGGQTDSAINGTLIMSDLERKMKQRAARALLKARLVAALRGFSGIAADAVPIAGEVYDAYVLARIVADFVELHADADAAITFAQGGPRALDALRLSLEDEGFSSFDAFGKDDEADGVEKRFGRPPTGYVYHHIVEQGGKMRGSSRRTSSTARKISSKSPNTCTKRSAPYIQAVARKRRE